MSWRNAKHLLGTAALLVALSACAPLPTTTPVDRTLPALEWPNGQTYWIDATRSEFRVQLSAEGPLARFGHPHVIGAQNIVGQVVVATPWDESVVALEVGVDDLIVDPPKWRAEAGLEPNIPQKDIDGTRANMRSAAQLHAEAFPVIALQSHRITGTRHEPVLHLWVSVAGKVTQQTLPIALHWGSGELIASAATTWQLSDLGIEPFSVFGGGLKVGDEIELRVRLYAILGSDQSIGE